MRKIEAEDLKLQNGLEGVFGCLGVFFLLFLSALVSAAEVAFFSLSAQDREEVLQKEAIKGQMVHSLLERPKKLLATLLVTNKCIKISAVLLFFVITNRLSWFDESPFFKFLVEVVVIAFLILTGKN